MGGGAVTGGRFGMDVRPDISKPALFIYPDPANRDPFVYLPFKSITYKNTCLEHRIDYRKECSAYFY